jgi:hypothetical protein
MKGEQMAAMAEQVTELFPGYRLEKIEESGSEWAYRVVGPKGRDWKLMRNKVNPHMLFPVPGNFMTDSMKIRGYTWFSDKSGELRPLK